MSEQIAQVRVEMSEFRLQAEQRINNLDEAMNMEGSQFQQMKRRVRGEIQYELSKVGNFHKQADFEFRRINSFMYHIKEIVGNIMEDIMLMQLI